MKKVIVENFLVSGIKIRTDNKTEFTPNNSKISKLWQNFHTKDIFSQIKNKKNDTIYGVYSSYQSDENGEYDVLVGTEVFEKNDNFENISIEKGEFLVFQNWHYAPNRYRMLARNLELL